MRGLDKFASGAKVRVKFKARPEATQAEKKAWAKRGHAIRPDSVVGVVIGVRDGTLRLHQPGHPNTRYTEGLVHGFLHGTVLSWCRIWDDEFGGRYASVQGEPNYLARVAEIAEILPDATKGEQ